LCDRCRLLASGSEDGAGAVADAGPAIGSVEAERGVMDPPTAEPERLSRDEVIRRTRDEFVVARPSELHPDLDVPGHWRSRSPSSQQATPVNPRRAAGVLRAFTQSRNGLFAIIVVAVVLATLIAFWLSPAP
jgi:hypothetical protein